MKEAVIIYHKKKLDPQTNQDVDYFFIIDSEIFIALGFKRLPEPLGRNVLSHAPKKSFKNISSLSIDDVIIKIMNIIEFDISGQSIVTNEHLASVFEEKNLELLIYTNTDEIISYEKRSLSLFIPENNPGNVEIRINVEDNPLIDSRIFLVLKGEKNNLYKMAGTIFSEKTIKVGQNYQIDIVIKLKSLKAINSLKAVLFFIQNINVDY